MTWANRSEMQELMGGFIAVDYLYQGKSPILIVLHDSLQSGVSERHRFFPAENERFHECSDRLSGDAGVVSWTSRNEGSGFKTVKFNDREYQLEKGCVFLVSVRLKDTPVAQLPMDGTSLQLSNIQESSERQAEQVKAQIEELAKREPTASAFFRKRAQAAK